MVTFTWNNIVKYFQTIAEHHYQLKGNFGSGFVDDIQATLKKNINYPFMYLIPLDDTVRENTNDARVGVIIVDLVKEDQRNQLEVLSDTNLIVKDIIKILRNEEVSNIQVLDEPTMEPFKERYADDTTGWVVEMSLQINFPNNYCDIPSDIFGPGGTETGLPSFSTNFLTCETLSDCERIFSIVAELNDHEARITALEQGGGGLTCEDVANCQVVLDILGTLSQHTSQIGDLETAVQSLDGNIIAITENLQGQIDSINTELDSICGADSMGYATSVTIADNSTIYFGSRINASQTTVAATRRKYYRGTSVTISSPYLTAQTLGTLGSNEPSDVYIRVNNTTDHLVGTIQFDTVYGTFTPEPTFTQIVLSGTNYVETKIVSGGKATNPTTVAMELVYGIKIIP